MDQELLQSLQAIVVARNGVADTVDCLCSMIEDGIEQEKIILVDNESSDGTTGIVRAEFKGVNILETGANLGYGGALNRALRTFKSRHPRLVYCLNNDIVIARGSTARLVDSMNRNADVGAICPVVSFFDRPEMAWFHHAKWIEDRARFENRLPPPGAMPNKAGLFDSDYVAGAAMLIRQDALEEVGFFDERYFLVWEETDWCYRARAEGWRVCVDTGALVSHRVSRAFGDGFWGPTYEYYFARNRLLWIEKNLSGRTRLKAMHVSAKDLMRAVRGWLSASLHHQDARVYRARILGPVDFLLRRFGCRTPP